MVAPKRRISEVSDLEIDVSINFTEEKIVKIRTDVTVDKDAPLEKKTTNKELLSRLQKIERDAINRARALGIIK